MMKSTIFLTFQLLFFFNILAYSQNSFEFTTKPGTEEWETLRTEKERSEALQIPDNTLADLSTKELVNACLSYPAFFHFAAYDDIQTGFLALSVKFNGINALMRRLDAGRELLSIYSNMSLNGFIDNELQLDDNYWPLRLLYIELLLSQQAIIGPMPVELQLELLRASRDKLDMKLSSNLNSIYDIQPTSLIMSRVMKIANFEDFNERIMENENLKTFNQTGSLPDEITLNVLVGQVDLFLNQL